MKHKTFFWFFLPTASAMLLFIALPIFSIVIQSLFTPHDAVIIVTENCDPFGCKQETTIDQEATRDLRKSEPLGKFVGLEIYKDRGHLAVNEIKEIWVHLTKMINQAFRGFRPIGLENPYQIRSEETTFQQQIKNPKGNVLEIELESLKKSMHEKFRELELKINLSEEDKKE